MAGLFGKSNANTITRYTQIGLQTSAQGLPIRIMWGQNRCAPNVIQLENFQSKPAKGTKGGKGGLGGKGAKQYTYSVAAWLALGEGEIQNIGTIWVSGTSTSTLADLNLTTFFGSPDQAPPSWVESNVPAHARSYAYTAYLFSSLYDLGSSPYLPDHNFEVWANLRGSMPYGYGVDANFADIILDFLTSPQYGAGLASAYIDATSLAFYKTYCQAAFLFASPFLDTQEQAITTLQRWAQLSNTWIFWSGSQLKFVPLGDSGIADNAVVYTPVLTVRYALTYDDFDFTGKSGSPITVKRIDPADGYSRVQLDVSDRLNAYNSTPVYWEDLTLETTYGQLQAVIISAPEVCDLNIAAIMAALIGQRSAWIRNTYEFKLPYWAVLLEPGDIVTLTDPLIGLVAFPVRIVSIDEGADQLLSIVAEEFPQGIGTATPAAQQTSNATPPFDTQVTPPNVNAPAFFEPPITATAGAPQLWIAVSGGANWGGAQVFVSLDGTNYAIIGDVAAPSQQGVLTAPLPAHIDPDTTDTLSVDTTESLSPIFSGVSQTDADQFTTAALVDNEIVCYGTVAATGTYSANLTYLRRGAYYTTPAAHLAGAPFARLNPNSAFVWPLPKAYVGQTLYFKFCSFNQFGLQPQDISTVSPYIYAPTGVAYTIAPPTNAGIATAALPAASVVVTWTASPGPAVGSYEVQLSQDGGVTWPIAQTTGPDVTSLTFIPVTGGVNYEGRVRAISQGGLAVSSWAYTSALLGGNIPTPAHPGRSAVAAEIVAAWVPPPPDPLQGNRQPTMGRRLPPSQLAVAVSAVVPVHAARRNAQQQAAAAAWTPGDAAPTQRRPRKP
jgi:Putative phage tail protein